MLWRKATKRLDARNIILVGMSNEHGGADADSAVRF